VSKSTKGASRRKYLVGIYKRAFGENPVGHVKEISRMLIEKLNIPYVQSNVKIETFVSSWVRQNRADLAPLLKNSVTRIKNLPVKKTLNYLENRDDFYKSWDWRTLRMQALKIHGPKCQCCGATRQSINMSGDNAVICVDHIEPLSKRWDLRLSLSNLQILCDECNMGKGSWDKTDWRTN
jgi:5-methylcytosine-specific restriction endonuclease McrA